VKRRSPPDADRYPVRDDSWWIVRGKRAHLFWCGDPLDVEPIPATPPDLVYVDPPWNGDIPGHFLLDVYRHVVALAAGGPCFCESPPSLANEVESVLPADYHVRWPLSHPRYTSMLYYAGPPLPDGFDPTDRDDDEDMIDVILRSLSGETVIDPYAGYGLTSRAAERQSWASINIEPHPRRISTALSRLSRLTGTEPRELE
jgi:hypothetical protein